FMFPTNDGLTCIAIGWPHRQFSAVRADLEASFMAAVDLMPELAGRVRAARREEPFRGTADLPNFFRRPHGPAWALIGDAGYHKAPYLAQAMTAAFHSADLLVEALDAGFPGRRTLEDALAAYERERNTVVMPMYRLNSLLATLEPPTPETLRLRAALRGNQA